jgi:pyrroloquinoline quinone (PQQ) biosynthesis protein C
MIGHNMPVLRRSAKVSRDGDHVNIDYLAERVELDGAAAELFAKAAPLLDGKKQVEEIAQSIGEKPARVEAFCEKLHDAGVVAYVQPPNGEPPRMSGKEFYELHHKYVRHWLQRIYEHPLWDRIASGKASRAQVLGFAFEKYHYIEGAYEHMAVAAANATPEMMPHLARHFIEEYTHGDIYRKGLRFLFPDDIVLNSQPLPSTRALVNFLAESAQRNSFAYYAGNELLQMTENTSDPKQDGSINSFYDAMRKHYPYTEKIINSFIAHTQADQKLGHEDVFLEMCESIPPLTRREVVDAMNTTRLMAEHLQLFMDGIDVHYGAFPTIPRVPSTLLSE